ncbi:VCBS repeat domain-containing M23 family metallopeptidase [Kribbella sp. NBC_01245]|uniref:peptidoglycan DD-metalloendopeptidase family protein n=1 Tax=Kribbella sp. NBC_01245 TaxID=2903578 RepID=UPI002E2AB602|nr:peptidoglycan DD-metalloendopeptidase family protein [Kribbella sp. NBC_01245]
MLKVKRLLAVLAAAAAVTVGLVVPQAAAAGRPNFKLPLPCGQVWTTSTHSGHASQYMLDMVRSGGATAGTPVLASAGGVVSTSKFATDAGNMIVIDHGDGWQTRYLHLATRAVNIGAQVGQGMHIGTVGNTGSNTSGAHLHFEQKQNGVVVQSIFSGHLVPVNYSYNQHYETSDNCGSGPITSSSLSGDARSDLAMVLANGDIKAWRNGRGFTDMPWDADAIVGTGFTPDNAFFADLDGDGRKEIIVVLPNGDLKAWHNDGGFAAMPWGANVIIGTGFSANNTFFADLNADGRSEVLVVMPNGDLKAWRNARGFAAAPWDADAVIATGFTPNNTFLADLNADGKAEAMTVLPNGDVKAWRNARGFAAMPWDADAIIATGFTANNLFLPDLDGDGKADITTVLANGDVKSWHNGAGFAPTPWNATATIATGFSPTNLLFA